VKTSESFSGVRAIFGQPMGNTIKLIHKGHIPSFKNAKHSGKTGFVYTDPKVKARMKAMTRDFSEQLSQLPSTSPTSESET
jgi:hypothetical protein